MAEIKNIDRNAGSTARGALPGFLAAAALGAALMAGVVGFTSCAQAQTGGATAAAPAAGAEPVVRARAAAQPATVARGGAGKLTLTLSVRPGYHIYAPKPGDEYAIPTTFKLSGVPAGVRCGAPKFPAPATAPNPAGGKPLKVYTGTVQIQVPFTVAATAKPGKTALRGSLGFQSCNDTSCLPPETQNVSAVFTVR